MSSPVPSLALFANLACLWEATARKPGNVHRFIDFEDATYLDFLASAAAIAPVLAEAPGRTVGATVLWCVQATRQVAPTNTNLGIILLLAPLAAVPEEDPLRPGVERILSGLTVEDSRQVFAAIRLARPSGLGKSADQDVHGEPTLPLREVMALAQDRDLIAQQYANGYREVFELGLEFLSAVLHQGVWPLEKTIIGCHLHLLALLGDSLIERKCGASINQEARIRAREVFDLGWPDQPAGQEKLAEFDSWLRADGHRRNPGTTADLVTACLFAALRQRIITLPLRWPWSGG